MSLLYWALTVGTIGKVLLGITVLMVHGRIFREHRIDKVVLSELRRERLIGMFSILLIIIGFVLELIFYFNSPFS